MNHKEVAVILRQFNEWRRGDEDIPQFDTSKIGLAIDAAVEMIDRLEEAESDALEQARLNGMGSEREAALMAKLEAAEKAVTEAYQRGYETGQEEVEKERDELRAKLEAADKSDAESIAMYRKARDERDALRAKVDAMERQKPVAKVESLTNGSYTRHYKLKWLRDAGEGAALYALPGAQPAPSVTEGWIQRGMAELEAIRSRQDDDTLLDDRTLIERIGKAMLAAAPESKP